MTFSILKPGLGDSLKSHMRWVTDLFQDLELPMEAYYSVQEQTSDEVPGESFGDAMMA